MQRGMVEDPSFCILPSCETLWEKIRCCFVGKRRLYKVLTSGVLIIVAHMILCKIIIFNVGFFFPTE